jgi:hypothetical protein
MVDERFAAVRAALDGGRTRDRERGRENGDPRECHDHHPVSFSPMK